MNTFTSQQKTAGVIHAIIMLFAYTSPLWLDWKLITLGVILYYIQLMIFGGCLLTKAQFGRFDASFTAYYLKRLLDKIGIKNEEKSIKRFIDLLAPTFVIIAIISQVIFKFKPLIDL